MSEMPTISELERDLAATQAMLDAIWKYCRVVYYDPDPIVYPLEHSPHARKDMRSVIESELRKRIPYTKQEIGGIGDD